MDATAVTQRGPIPFVQNGSVAGTVGGDPGWRWSNKSFAQSSDSG